MDPRLNPYAPGAGTPPPELAGRDETIEKASVALDRIRGGRAARSLVLYGLRGVGKTVLLNKTKQDAVARGFIAVSVEAPENRSLPAVLAPALRGALLRLSRSERAMELGTRALRALGGFASALKVTFADIEIGIDWPLEKGLADSGDLDHDLSELIGAVGQAAAAEGTAVVLFIDELQYIKEGELAALITAFHNASQSGLPVTMVAAGLPQLLGKMGEAKSYAERLFEFVAVDKLDAEAAKRALTVPAAREGAAFTPEALEHIGRETQGYPYFLQEWGKHSWDLAPNSPINLEDARAAGQQAVADLDASFFQVRLDRLTPAEKQYVRAMAELGAGTHRSGDIAGVLGRDVTSVAPIRNSLIRKGMVYSPAHGDTAFTVPLFDGFMRRSIPKFYRKA